MSKHSSKRETPKEQSDRDRNPNNPGFKASLDNRSIQLQDEGKKGDTPAPPPVKKP